MPHSYLKVVGNPEYRCNNSSPRYMRENHYAISCISLKISYVFTYKINITFLLFFLCLEQNFVRPLAKIRNFIEIQSNTIKITFWILYFFLVLLLIVVNLALISPIAPWTIRWLAVCLWSAPICYHQPNFSPLWKCHSWFQVFVYALRNKFSHCIW